MIKSVKKILYKILGQTRYLKTMHFCFFVFYDFGFLKNNHSFKYHYFVKNLINEGDYVLDLGANLGYFSKIFSRAVGMKGKVICIEPVNIFYNTLKWGLRKQSNCIFYNHALGLENKTIELVLPKMNGNFRTGLAHIDTSNNEKTDCYIFETEMVQGSVLLKDLNQLDYIKCDIEGYEEFVLPEMIEILIKHKPMIQVETVGSHKIIIFNLMKELGYIQYGLREQKIVKDFQDELECGDFLFIHSSKEKNILSKLKTLNLA